MSHLLHRKIYLRVLLTVLYIPWLEIGPCDTLFTTAITLGTIDGMPALNTFVQLCRKVQYLVVNEYFDN